MRAPGQKRKFSLGSMVIRFLAKADLEPWVKLDLQMVHIADPQREFPLKGSFSFLPTRTPYPKRTFICQACDINFFQPLFNMR